MQTLFQTQGYLEKVEPDISGAPIQKKRQNPKFFLFLLGLLGMGVVIYMANEDFLVERDGKPDLAPWRKAKLMKELEDMEEGEQYVLKAVIPGLYPCYHCKNSDKIFLNKGDVWKYGVTSKGEKGRYKGHLPVKGLFYYVQYEGLLQVCYKKEKIQIYNYALLPENLIRKKRLIRPPGNKQDN